MHMLKANTSASCIKAQNPTKNHTGKHSILRHRRHNPAYPVAPQRFPTPHRLNWHRKPRSRIRTLHGPQMGKMACCNPVLCRNNLHLLHAILHHSHRHRCIRRHDCLHRTNLDIYGSGAQKTTPILTFQVLSLNNQTRTSSSASINC